LKWLLIILLVAGCVIGITDFKVDRRVGGQLEQNIRLGLDLRGGSHMVLQIQVQDAFRSEADLVIERLRKR
jgi:preprotein translocase subunit SecD